MNYMYIIYLLLSRYVLITGIGVGINGNLYKGFVVQI